MTNVGLMAISFEVLEQALHLPDEVRIVSVEPEEWCYYNVRTFRVKLVGPGLPFVVEGAAIPEVSLEPDGFNW